MKKVIENLAALIKVKTLVTTIVIIVFAVLALKGVINAESVMYVVTSVVAFYFGTQHESNVAKTDSSNNESNKSE